MDVTSFIGAITGGNNVKIDININTIPDHNKCILLDHTPSWRLHKNPFWRIKNQQQQLALNSITNTIHNNNNNQQQQVPTTPTTMNQQQQQQQQQPYQNTMYRNHYDPNQQQQQQPQPQMQNNNPNQQQQYIDSNNSDILYAFESTQDIDGVVTIRLLSGTNKGQEHLGIKVMFIGRIDMSISGTTIDTTGSGKSKYDFISISKELIPPGTIYQMETLIPFKFKGIEKEFDSYYGRNVAVRYFIRVTMERKFLPMIKYEKDIWIQSILNKPMIHEPIKMEVGIEDCLHIEFEYYKKIYHLHDIIYGKIHFLLVRIKIKHMELAVIRRETSGGDIGSNSAAIPNSGGDNNNNNIQTSLQQNNNNNMNSNSNQNVYTETQTLIKYEIMDGGPIKGEMIPVKLSLRGIPADLTPTYMCINNRFSVRYYLNLVLVDDDDRRYFKQQEIFLYRHELGS